MPLYFLLFHKDNEFFCSKVVLLRKLILLLITNPPHYHRSRATNHSRECC